MIDILELHALADGELSELEAKRLREKIAADPQASSVLNTIYNLKDCVRSKALVIGCETTWQVSVKRLAEIDRAKGVQNFVWKFGWGLSGAFFVMIVCAGVISRNMNTNRVESSDIARAVATIVPIAGSKSIQPSNYDRWLDGLIGQAKQTLTQGHMRLLGMGVGTLNGLQVVRYSLRDGEGDIDMLVLPGGVNFQEMNKSADQDGFVMGQINGKNCVARQLHSHSIVLAGDRSYAALEELALHVAD